MAFTIRSGSWVSYVEAVAAFKRLGGDDPGLSTTDNGQMLTVAINAAYDRIVECGRNQGYTLVQLGTWAKVKEVHLYATCYYAGRDPTVFGGAEYFDPVLKSYLEDLEAFCQGGPIYTEAGVLIAPDVSSGGAAQYQIGKQDRNGTLGDQHDFVFDWSPNQFAGAPGVADAAAGRRSSNTFRSPGL